MRTNPLILMKPYWKQISGTLLVMVLALGVSAQTPPEPGSVTGMLKQAGTGKPMDGISIMMFLNESYDPILTTTDQAGHFEFLNLPPGSYGIRPFSETNYRPEQGGGPLNVSVGSGQHVQVELALVPGSIIRGRVFAADGSPLTGANVSAEAIVYAGGPGGMALYGGVTDNHGDYRIAIPPGEYYIQATSRRGGSVFTPTYFPGTSEFKKARSLVVNPGEERIAADFTIQNPETYKVSGKTSGELFVDLKLVPTDMPSNPVTSLGVSLYKPLVPTEHDGEFQIKGVLPGSYELLAMRTKPQGERKEGSFFQSSPDDQYYFGHVRIDVGNADVESVLVEIAPMLEAKVQIVSSSDSPAIPLDKVRMRWAAIGRLSDPSEIHWIRRGADNKFTEVAAQNSRYVILLSDIPDNAYIADILQGTSSVLQSGVSIGKRSPDLIQVILKSDGAIIEGTVQDENSKGIPFTDLVLIPKKDLRWNFGLQKNVPSDGSGHFTFRGVAPGEYKVFAWEHLYSLSSLAISGVFPDSFISQYEDLGTAVVVEAGSHVENIHVQFIPAKH